MRFESLPEQCQACIHLHCGHVYMNGEGCYSCFKVPVFLKNKQYDCPKYKGDTEQ